MYELTLDILLLLDDHFKMSRVNSHNNLLTLAVFVSYVLIKKGGSYGKDSCSKANRV